jgi:hypothetical protein
VQQLAGDAADGAAGDDDRALGAERPAGADADRAGQRLEDRQARLHPAAAQQDRLHRLRDAVAADPLGAEARHEPDDEAAEDRHEDARHAERAGIGTPDPRREAAAVEQVGE